MLIDRLLAGLRAWLAALRSRPGIVASLAIHLVLIALLIGVNPARTREGKRGDALIVELPSVQEPANLGTPGPVPDAPSAPRASARPAPPAPPAPKLSAPPAPRPQIAARPAPRASEPREAPRTPPAPSPPAPAAEGGDVPAAKSAPAEPAPEVAKAAPEPARQEPPAPPAPAAPPAVASTPPSPPGPAAMAPPSAPAPPDIRTALRRGGGGGGTGLGGAAGTGVGRGGIVGDPVPLDSKDSDVRDYLDRIKRLIQQHWVFPCVKDRQTGICEYKSTELLVEFGILKHGPLQYIAVRRASPYEIYDEYAVTAVKLASPFPPVPAAMMARMGSGSTGAAISARFVYHFETGITNLLR